MKARRLIYTAAAVSLILTSCDGWLTKEDPTQLSLEQAYSSASGITSIAANLYGRLNMPQNFKSDSESYDLCRWDEAVSNSYYWQFSTNVGTSYRNYYDYDLIRDINLHIKNLEESAGDIPQAQKDYFIGEARFLRAYTYFQMVKNLGGVPLVTEVYEYTNQPLEYAKPRNTEAEVYDFIIKEMDEVKDVLDVSPAGGNLLTRASKAAALALKSRAALYAGTLAVNSSVSADKGLNLASGATGIASSRANDYLEACIDAWKELKATGKYSLLTGTGSSLAENFSKVFITKSGNPELIFIRDYDGSTDFPNNFTMWNIPRSMRSGANFGAHTNPTLNLVESFESVTGGQTALKAYVGAETVESMGDESSALEYVLYDSPDGIFAGRDPRLAGSVILPGESFRGTAINLQAGLAVKTASGYDFKSLDLVDNYGTDKNLYNGEQMTSLDGPYRNSFYTGHSGFLLRKYMDTASGSESSGKSSVAYIVFRYAELVLNAAEAAFYLDGLGVGTYDGTATSEIALSCVNEVRRRAGGEEFCIPASRLTLDLIRNEQRVEFAFEDHRVYDLKRWRIADEVWDGQWNSETARLTGLWPYKVYAPGTSDDGKWLFRRVYIEHRGSDNEKGLPVKFSQDMYYSQYPTTDGNPYIEKNPKH